ncbi:MAG: molybdate ABC transporter permease subunit [Planctomycetes bacterium]|nr:molybdate ABC transporter permease subunit [Planctomycetota bacterium]
MTASDAAHVTLLTLRIGAVATLLILVPAVALGYALARRRFPGRSLVQAAVSLPMVLPPVAVGLLLLMFLSPRGATGRVLQAVFGGPILLTWWAAALAAAAMSFPLLVLGAQQAFAATPRRLENVARTLGASPARVFLQVTLPLSARGLAHGLTFAFARALGEFGATAIVAGRIPGETETLSLAIYGRIEAFQHGQALALSAISIALAFVSIAGAEMFLRRRDA